MKMKPFIFPIQRKSAPTTMYMKLFQENKT